MKIVDFWQILVSKGKGVVLTSGVVVVDVVDVVVAVVVAVVEVVVILAIMSLRSGEHNAGSSVNQQYLYHFTVNYVE